MEFITKDYKLRTLGKRSFISFDTLGKAKKRSDYYDSFSQGATIVPRTFWLVDIVKHPIFGVNKNTPFVKSSERAKRLAKPEYGETVFEGQIESRFLYATLTSNELLPYGYQYLPTVILPLEVTGNKLQLIDRGKAQKRGLSHLDDWLAKAELARSFLKREAKKMREWFLEVHMKVS